MNIFGIVGWKNSGKTGLVVRLVKALTARGYIVSTLKHAHHSFELDQPGKDSFRHREAGASEVLVASSTRWALLHESRKRRETAPSELVAKLEPADIVLVEGFKRFDCPKIETRRLASRGSPLAGRLPNIVAIASDSTVHDATLPVFELDATNEIADFIERYFGLSP